MRIVIDRKKCAGIGLCEATAPHILELGEDSQAHALHDELPADEIAAAEEAVRSCPTAALRITE